MCMLTHRPIKRATSFLEICTYTRANAIRFYDNSAIDFDFFCFYTLLFSSLRLGISVVNHIHSGVNSS